MPAWKKVADRWKALRDDVDGARIAPKESFARHTALIVDVFDAMDATLDRHALSLDPDLEPDPKAPKWKRPVGAGPTGRSSGGGAVDSFNGG